jgi:hypothetical protein
MLRRHDLIFVVVDIVIKSAHSVPTKTTYQALKNVKVFVNEKVRLHVIPKNIISERGSIFIGIF